jgi:prepilin signal peptidase PulO-like enzyme (type II secretory pathway)
MMLKYVPAILVLAALLLPGTASAYIGPGAGLSAIGSLLALIGAVLLAIVGFVWYPVRRLLRRGKTGKGSAPPAGKAAGEDPKDPPRT